MFISIPCVPAVPSVCASGIDPSRPLSRRKFFVSQLVHHGFFGACRRLWQPTSSASSTLLSASPSPVALHGVSPEQLAPLLNCSLMGVSLSTRSLSPTEGADLWRCPGSFVFVPFQSFTGAGILKKFLVSRLIMGALRLRSVNLLCFLRCCPYSGVISQAIRYHELLEDGDCLTVACLCSSEH